MAIQKPTLSLLRQLLVAIGGEADSATRSLTQAWTRSWDDLSVAWRGALDDVVAKAAATGEWPSAWELGRMERLGRAVGESETALTQLSKRAGVEITDGAGKVVGIDADYEPRLVSSQLPAAEAAVAATVYSARVTPTALDFIVARSQSQIASTLIPLSADATEAMRRSLIQGIAVGANPRVAASQMVARVEGAFNGGLSRAINIARTEMLDAYRSAARYSHAANADVVTGWVWLSTLDGRTCPACWSMHGRVFPVTQPGPLDHQQGRCARAPKTKSWADLGFNVKEPADEIPDARAVFGKLSADRQRAIMGPGRLGLLNSGKVGWNDLASLRASVGWRQSYVPRAVTDLQRLANGRRVTDIPLAPSRLPTPLARQLPKADALRPGLSPAQFDAAAAKAAKGGPALDAVPYKRGALPRTARVGNTTAGEIDDALSDYSQGYWMGINQSLRKGNLDDPRWADRIRNIDAGMTDSATRTEILVTRGVQKPGEIFGDGWLSRDLAGFEWIDRGFVSTTANVGLTGRTFFTGTSGARLRLLVPKGTRAAVINDVGETELLLNRGLSFRVVRDRGVVDGIRHLDVEIMPATRAVPAVTAATDPALKMTIAQLKAIAKANNVPLFGSTKKHDIISIIRRWESDKLKSGGKILIPDGPIGKRIKVGPPPIVAPPLAPPASTSPVLTGARLNDWDDEFRYGPLGPTADTPAAGFAVNDLRVVIGALDGSYPSYMVKTGTAWRFNGVSYLIEHGPNGFGAPWVSRALTELRAAHDAIPAAGRANKAYAILTSRNPSDVYWQVKFNNPSHMAAASAGQGRIFIWNFRSTTSRVAVDTLRHETGHNLDYLVGRTTAGSESSTWTAAANADAITAARITNLVPTHPEANKMATVEPSRGYPNGVTHYGRSSAAEDYAESVMLYQLGPIATGRLPGVVIPKLTGVKLPPGAVAVTDREILYFRDIYPKRAAILDKLFPDIAKAQKAEIAALRAVVKVPSLDKMTVPQLRALAKERGVNLPTGAKKADIVTAIRNQPDLSTPEGRRAALRIRQAEIDKRTAVADLLADFDELIGKGQAPKVFLQRLATTTSVDKATIDALRKALASGDPAKLRLALSRLGTKHGLKPVGRAGVVTKFDPKLHEPIGATPSAGAKVKIVRRGTELDLNGEKIQLGKAQVVIVEPKPAGAPKAYTGPSFKMPEGVDKQLAEYRELTARRIERMRTKPGQWTQADLDDERRMWEVRDKLPPAVARRLEQETGIDFLAEGFRALHASNMTTKQMQADLARRIRETFAGKKVAVRTTPTGLMGILRDGRFKSQFEGGKSRGLKDLQVRARYEEQWFGLDTKSDPTKRPIYGYVMVDGYRAAGIKDADALSQYGRVQVVLKDDVRKRTTAMIGDSLDVKHAGWSSPIDDPEWQSFTPGISGVYGSRIAKQGLRRDYSTPEFRADNYAEAQIHGGVKLDDIEEIILPIRPTGALRKLLDDLKISWRVMESGS